MVTALGSGDKPSAVRALAGQGTDDPGLALLDAFAVVADTVSFYTERFAQESFLRTATEPKSVRHLAVTIGYQPRPGVSATADLAFDVEDAPGAPRTATVPAGTPVRSMPGQDELPQIFETTVDLDARAVWNTIPGATSEPQEIRFGDRVIWLRGTGLGMRAGDGILVVGAERRNLGSLADAELTEALERGDDKRWDFRIVLAVDENPDGLSGWTRLRMEPVDEDEEPSLVADEDAEVHLLAGRANLFGSNAPMAALLVGTNTDLTDLIENGEWVGIDNPTVPGPGKAIEVDGDQPRIVAGSWLLLERGGNRKLYLVKSTAPDGATRFGVSGRLTRIDVDVTENLDEFGRRRTLVRSESRRLPGKRKPIVEAVTGHRLRLAATDPPLPVGRRVVVTGYPPGAAPADRLFTDPPQAESAAVVACKVRADGTMTVDLDRELEFEYEPQRLQVRGNVVSATHGETVEQVLGSGDAAIPFQRFGTRRGPLAYIRAATPSGAESTLELRVDGVRWDEIESLDVAAAENRVYTLKLDDAGLAAVTAGDGSHGARPATGSENVSAVYRVAEPAQGGMNAGQLSQLPRRPLGVRGITNPAPARDWAAPESTGDARRNAPLRIRTFERVVSVADHEDFAAAFAGVTSARADAVWDGREQVVVVSLLGAAGRPAGSDLVASLRASMAAGRDPGTRFLVLPGEVVMFGIEVDVAHDPAVERRDVVDAIARRLAEAFSAPALPFAAGLTASRVLVTVRSVPGVRACTMPRLALPDGAPTDILAPLPARWSGAALPAQALGLIADAVQIGVMRP
ncbi:hypothetical protein [Nocardia amamiensis]|uniref:hypothetical protein n=1 Tax=Nocardia amamiensis TaxID=404578 RepID=UPI0034067DB6